MKRIASIIAAIAAVILAFLIISDAVTPKQNFNFFAMNTYVSGEIEGGKSDNLLQDIEDIIGNLDSEILSRTAEGSFVYDLNKNDWAIPDVKMTEYFETLREICKKSDGAFDFTLGGVSDLWNFSGTPSIPDSAALAAALSHSGYEKVTLADKKITLTDKSAVVDFGASGKGIALDCVRDYLETQNAKRAVVSVGGSVLLFGKGDFTVGIKNPFGGADFAATLTVNGCCISTSGTYEQYFEKNGKRYHHILDPKTGYPAESGVISATVISESGLLSDALSTACFVLGMEKGFDLAEEFGAEVIFITENGEIHLRENSEITITPAVGDFTLVKH